MKEEDNMKAKRAEGCRKFPRLPSKREGWSEVGFWGV